MIKEKRRIICVLFAVCMIVTALMIPDTKAAAAAATKKVHIGVKQTWSEGIEVTLEKGEYKIANLKTSGKNLYARITYTHSYHNSAGTATISMYAKKKGKYTVSFDVVDRQNRKTTSHKATVYAYDDNPVKKVTFDGEDTFYRISSKAKGKFKVTMTKGYSLQSIKVTTYDKSGKAVTKKLKNGSSVTLGKYRYKNAYGSGAAENWHAGLLATTNFEITYKDKYTKQSRTTTYMLYRVPKN